MTWIWLLVLVVAALLAFRFLGRLLATLIALVVFSAIGIYAYQEWRRVDAAKHISAQEIVIDQLRLIVSPRGPRELLGRIHNRSARSTLTYAEIEIQLQDCVADDCDIVDAETVTLRTQIPPGQSRELRQPLFLKLPNEFKGEQRIGYQVIRTRAE